METLDGEVLVLVAEDDDADYQLLSRAMDAAGVLAPRLRFLDGTGVLEYLRGRRAAPGDGRPGRIVILLDQRMPGLDGAAAAAALKSDPELRRLPVIILASEPSPGEVRALYWLGADTVLVKPSRFEDYVREMRVFREFWLETAVLPAL